MDVISKQVSKHHNGRATMKTTLYLLAIFSALQLTTAQEISFGKCPKFSVIQNFDPQRVMVKDFLDESMCKKLTPESIYQKNLYFKDKF